MKTNVLKIIRNILGVLCFFGFLFLVGTFGALDNDSIPFKRGMIQAVISAAVFIGSGMGAMKLDNEIEWRERQNNKK